MRIDTYIKMQNAIMGDMNGEIYLSDEALEQVEAVCFETILREYERPMGRQTVGFWHHTRYIPAIYSSLNLYFKREDINGVGRWTVYGYRIDTRKEKPFWTVESSKTLIFKDKLLHPDDLYRGQEDYEDYDDYED